MYLPHFGTIFCFFQEINPLINSTIDSQTDWVPGAFSIIRKELFDQLQGFDEQFFLYYEEVDLCKRIKQAGFEVWYWPEIEVIHLGGESSKTLNELEFTPNGSQLTLWEMRSALLYWRKHHGTINTYLYYSLNRTWQGLRKLKHGKNPFYDLIKQAWIDTKGGTYSPSKPW